MRFFAREMNNCLSWILEKGYSVRIDIEGHEYPLTWAWGRYSTAWSNETRRSGSWGLSDGYYDDGWFYRSHPQGKPKEERIKAVIDQFDFVKVRKMMVAVNWTWRELYYSPSIEEMKKEAERLLAMVFDSERSDAWISCGGFTASKRKELLILQFVAEEQEE